MNKKNNRPRRGTSQRRLSGSRLKSGSHRRFQGNKPSKPIKGRSFSRGKGRPQRQSRKIPTFNPAQFINQNPVDLAEEIYTPKHKSFAEFKLNKFLFEAIANMGLKTPSPIQDQIIPEILKDNDVVGLAETGTGKTAAFLIPLIEKTLKQQSYQTLILAPTRELAVQIEAELKRLSHKMHLHSVVCVGGVNINSQIRALKRKNHFIIGTPGRVIDLLNRKDLTAINIKTVVLDEADRMLDMGFINDMKRILAILPPKRETLFFSATMPKDAERLVHNFLNNPTTVSVKKKDVTNSIEQDVVIFDQRSKFETLIQVLKNPDCERVLIFGSMKHSVQKLSRELGEHGIPTDAIHGNKSHGQRQRALAAFKQGKIKVLVATDVAARGIHIDNVTHVINYDLPQTFEDYVHRIGRTGRAKNRGKALTFVHR